MTNAIHTILTRSGRWPVFILSFLYCIFIFLYHDSFKLGFLVSIGLCLLFYWIIRDVFVSLFSVFMLSSFFLFPSKNYTFLYASPLEYHYELLPMGIYETLSVGIAEIFGLFLLFYFIRERITNSFFVETLNNHLVLGILASWFVYYAFSIYSSLQFSVFPGYSLNLLMLSGKMILVFLGIVYLFVFRYRIRDVFFVILLSVLLFQNIVGVRQFIFNLSPSGSALGSLQVDVEERTNFRRVQGASDHPNTHAFTVSLLCIICAPYVWRRMKKYGWIFLLSLLDVAFSQSRTIWLLLALQSALVVANYPRQLLSLIAASFRNSRVIIFMILIGGLFSLIIVPRMTITDLFFSEEGGGGLRMKMISQSWKLLLQAPWTGFGVGTNVRVFLNKMPNSYVSMFPFSVHFTPLQIALESGVFATIAFFMPFYLIFRSWFSTQSVQRLKSVVGMCVVCAMILIVGYYFVQPIYIREGYFLVGMYIGVAAVFQVRNSKKFT